MRWPVPLRGADRVIGDRAYGDTPEKVAAVRAAVARASRTAGVLPCSSHIPGHGRATADSNEHPGGTHRPRGVEAS